MTRNTERNPVSEIYAINGEKPGFYEFLGWVTRNTERNPVSEIYAINGGDIVCDRFAAIRLHSSMGQEFFDAADGRPHYKLFFSILADRVA